jgi:hypothetical protein
MSRQKELSQYMTPDWVPIELISEYFRHVKSFVEPSCGRGAFLRAIPKHLRAVGVDIDPDMARFAAASTGRQVIVGDFATVELPFQPEAIISNPPFRFNTVMRFLDRAFEVLPDDGQCGFLLPCYVLARASTIEELRKRWSIRQDLLPRNLFPRITHPLLFAVLTKGTSGKLWNFSLFEQQSAIDSMQRRYRELLTQGETSVWAAVTRAALEAIGGAGSLADIYREVEGHRPTANKFWQAKIRQTLQAIAVQIRRGYWALPQPSLFASEAA